MKICNEPRYKTIGGSGAAAILDLNPYESRYDVWLKKLRIVQDDFKENRYTRWGHQKEDCIAQFYAERHGVVLLESPKRYRAERKWMTGTPDRLIVYGGNDFGLGTYDDPISGEVLVRRGLEVKTALGKHGRKWDIAGQVNPGWDGPAPLVKDFEDAEGRVPLNYWVQCQWYMQLMDFTEWDLCVLLDSSDYREYRLYRDQDWLDYAIEECENFWIHNVLKERPPKMDWGKMVNKYLTSEFKDPDTRVREATAVENALAKELREVGRDMSSLLAESKALKEERDHAEEELAEVEKELVGISKKNAALQNCLKELIGYDGGIETECGVITWKESAGGGSRRIHKRWNKD